MNKTNIENTNNIMRLVPQVDLKKTIVIVIEKSTE